MGLLCRDCQDVEFFKNRDMKNISQVFINIRVNSG